MQRLVWHNLQNIISLFIDTNMLEICYHIFLLSNNINKSIYKYIYLNQYHNYSL